MITGFLTFVLWVLIVNKMVVDKYNKKPPETFIQKAIMAVTPTLVGGILIRLYCVHWDILATILAVAFFIILIIRGLFRF